MAIRNNLCETCIHSHLCTFRRFIDKFDDDIKSPLGIDITMDRCTSYEKEEDK